MPGGTLTHHKGLVMAHVAASIDISTRCHAAMRLAIWSSVNQCSFVPHTWTAILPYLIHNGMWLATPLTSCHLVLDIISKKRTKFILLSGFRNTITIRNVGLFCCHGDTTDNPFALWHTTQLWSAVKWDYFLLLNTTRNQIWTFSPC